MNEPQPTAAGGVDLDAATLEALDGDEWGQLLPVLRAALNDLDDTAAGPAVRRLRATPTGRLVVGRSRRELCALVVEDARVHAAVQKRLADASLSGRLRAALAGGRPSGDATPAAVPGNLLQRLRREAEDATRRAERSRRRLRALRDERDRLARRLEGARARAEGAREEAEAGRAREAELRVELEALAARVEQAGRERQRAVDRERRRLQGELTALRDEVRELRRRDERRRAEVERLRAERRVPVSDTAASVPNGPAAPRLGPGRPSRLPETVASGTAEEVDHLLDRGRLVAVDGYNVTLQHRPRLDLVGQRDWLIRRLGTLAAQRGVRPVVVFDGERASGARPPSGVREVEVRFTAAGITADDELLFLVEALPEDEPVLAVTDDRELRERLVARGVDVVGAGPFLWATPK